MVGPWAHYLELVKKAGNDMGNIEYLAIKEFDGKLKSDEGLATSPGDIATLTAAGGKDMYLASAKCVFYTNPAAGFSTADEAVLKVNGVIKETVKYSQLTAVGNGTFEYEFKNIGHKVATTEIIKIEAIAVDTDTEIEGFIECFEEETGASPQIPAI